jgi:hypothetical protein
MSFHQHAIGPVRVAAQHPCRPIDVGAPWSVSTSQPRLSRPDMWFPVLIETWSRPYPPRTDRPPRSGGPVDDSGAVHVDHG